MNTEEMIDYIADRNRVTRAEAKRQLDAVTGAINHGLSTSGNRLNFRTNAAFKRKIQ